MSTVEALISPPKHLPMLNPPKRLLFGAGPAQVHPRIYKAMGKPVVGHLDPFFFEISGEIQQQLRRVFGTTNQETFVISATGSGGMETAISNFVESGTKVAVFANGFFCDRLSEMARRQGAEVVRFEKGWGDFFGDAEAAEFIRRERPQVVAYVQALTSTGVFQSGKAICAAAHEVDAVVIADCVTSLGAMPVAVDETGIDVAFSCSQKGLSCPPGLSPITLSPRASERLRSRKSVNRSWYFDLKLLNDYYIASHRYHHTAPISMFYALHEGLTLIAEEGLERRWDRHRRAHEALVHGIEAMGLHMYVAEGHRIWNLNTVSVPDEVDETKVRGALMREYGIEIGSGFGQLAGKIFRVGLMGPLATEGRVRFFLRKFEKVLRACGYPR